MAVGDNNGVDYGDLADVAGSRGIPLRSQPGDGRAAILEDRVEEHSQARAKLHIEASMS